MMFKKNAYQFIYKLCGNKGIVMLKFNAYNI